MTTFDPAEFLAREGYTGLTVSDAMREAELIGIPQHTEGSYIDELRLSACALGAAGIILCGGDREQIAYRAYAFINSACRISYALDVARSDVPTRIIVANDRQHRPFHEIADLLDNLLARYEQ